MEEEKQKKFAEFNRGREQLMNIGSRKQQAQMQSGMLQSALDELKESKQEKVFKLVGNIMLEKDSKTVEKELNELKEQMDGQVETLQKQEDSLVNRLNKIKTELESSAEQKE